MTDIAAAIREPLEVECTDGQTRKLRYIGGTILCEFSTWINAREGNKPRDLVGMDKISSWADSPVGMRWLLWKCMQKVNDPCPPEGDVGDLLPFHKWPELIVELLDMPKEEPSEDSDPP